MAYSPMCTLKASLAFCLVLCSFRLTLGTEFAGGLKRVPAFVWSSEPYIASVSEGQTSRVSYEVRQFEELLQGNPSETLCALLCTIVPQ